MPFIRINVGRHSRFINSDHIIWIESMEQGGSYIQTTGSAMISETDSDIIMERILETSHAAKIFAAQTAATGVKNQ